MKEVGAFNVPPSPYPWNNKKRLNTLDAHGSVNTLVFKAPFETAIVTLNNGDIEKVLFSGDGEFQPPALRKGVEIDVEDAKEFIVGGENENTTRRVVHFLMPDGPAPTMRLGITHHLGEGTWSSLPHDFELNTEPGFEEVFFHILQGETRRGFQVGRGVWHDNSEVDDVWPIKSHAFSTVPMGYHPVVGEPGVRVSYIWAYLAKHPRWEKVKA